MIIGLTFFLFCSLGQFDRPMDRNAIKELEKQGFSTSAEDMERAVEKAFSDSDVKLFESVCLCFRNDWERDKHADKMMALYASTQDEKFKESIFSSLIVEMSQVRRIVQSRHGCLFYDRAIELLCVGPYPKKINTAWDDMPFTGVIYTSIGVYYLSKSLDFDPSPIYIKALLTLPVNGNYVHCVLRHLKDYGKIPAAAAYYIYERHKDDEKEEYLKPYKELAHPYLSGEKSTEKLSLDAYSKQLDGEIEECRKKIHERFQDAPPAVYVEEGEPVYMDPEPVI